MKIDFLDFDGPIIPIQSHENRRGRMEKAWPACVKALNRITDTTGAKIVVTSSWRDTSVKKLYNGQALEEMKSLLDAWNVTGEVLGITPYYVKSIGNFAIEVPRGQEIASFLKACDEVESFVILDDDDDMKELKDFIQEWITKWEK